MMTTQVQGLTAVGGEFSPDIHAGVLVISRVADRVYDLDAFRAAWQSEGLDPDLLPEARQPVNDFQNACRSVETRRGRTSGRKIEVKVDEALNNGAECVYQLTRMERDEANRVIEHQKEMRVVFDKRRPPADAIDVDVLGHDMADELHMLELRIREHYDMNRGKLPGPTIRALIRTTFEETHSIPWAGGKVYFTPIEHADTMKAIARVLEQVCGEHADFDLAPMAPTELLRKQIDKHGTRALVGDATDLMVDVAERLKKDGPVRGEMIDRVLSQRAALGAMRKRVADLVGRETEAINEQVRLLDDQIDALMDRRA